jgi:hypothetical protein
LFVICATYVPKGQVQGGPECPHPQQFRLLHPPQPAKDRSRSRRAARIEKFKRERVVIDYLNRGVSVREIAAQLGVTEKRMRAIVKEVLAAHMPGPPQEFVALQISRLNEALLVAYSAMSGMNLKAVDRVVRIVRELDRYHGFFRAERRSPRDEREVEAKVEEPRGLLPRRPEMAPQALEKPQSAPEKAATGMCHSRESGDPESPGANSPSFAPLRPWMPASAGMTEGGNRPEMAPQAPEKAQSAPENDTAPNCSDEAIVSFADPAQAPSALDASLTARPEMAPQAPEKAQSTPESGTAPNCSDDAFISLVDAAQAPSALDATLTARPEMAPQAPEKAQSAPEKDTVPNSSDDALISLAALPFAPSALDASLTARPEMAPQAPEKPQSAPENDMAPAPSDEPFLSPLAASAQDPHAYEPPSTAPIETSPQNAAGAQSPLPCASPLSPGLANPNQFKLAECQNDTQWSGISLSASERDPLIRIRCPGRIRHGVDPNPPLPAA